MAKLAQYLTAVETVKSHALGEKYLDPVNGDEFVYLTGVGSTVVGSVVSYDEAFLTTLLDTDVAASLMGPLAVAMAITDATTEFGWYQVKGPASVLAAGTVADNARLQPTATAGQVDDTTTGAVVIVGMWSRGAGTTGTVMVAQLDYPKLIDVSLT